MAAELIFELHLCAAYCPAYPRYLRNPRLCPVTPAGHSFLIYRQGPDWSRAVHDMKAINHWATRGFTRSAPSAAARRESPV